MEFTPEERLTAEILLAEYGKEIMDRYPFQDRENTCHTHREYINGKREKLRQRLIQQNEISHEVFFGENIKRAINGLKRNDEKTVQ